MSRACPNCGSALVREYCPDCGQRALAPDDYSIRSHAADVVDLLTNLDNKVMRTVGTLIMRPGALTADHLAGRRARYLRPLQLFLLVNVLLFIVAPKVALFSYSLDKYRRNTPPSPSLVASMVARATPPRPALTRAGVGGGADRASIDTSVTNAYTRAFDGRVETQRKSLIILFVPALAVILQLLFIRQRSGDAGVPRRYGEHLVFALHLLAFVWLAFAASYAILTLPGRAVSRPWGIALLVIAQMILLGAPAYTLFAVRRVYRLSWGKATAATGALAAAFLLLIIAYRGLLFFTTYYSL